MRCSCGRLLTDPVSRARGLGPVCYRRSRGRTRRRLIGTRIPLAHPAAIPARHDTQLAFEIWADDPDDEPDPYAPRPITDVPTGGLL
ncbi:DUF6011 domain-containing protein [Streptomyces sp. G1]|nr:DUF6011 domain-containing protein [Streptomyces sp. G1]